MTNHNQKIRTPNLKWMVNANFGRTHHYICFCICGFQTVVVFQVYLQMIGWNEMTNTFGMGSNHQPEKLWQGTMGK